MVDFACKTIDSKELIKCTFGLNKTELDIFLILSKSNKCENIHSISRVMSLDRTTIQKALKKLLDNGTIERKQKNLSSGGFVFYYCIKNKEMIKEKMKTIISEWSHIAKKEIDFLFK